MNEGPELTILGGGPAGLAAGHFARARGVPFRIFEARAEVGGNARTLSFRAPGLDAPFLFDTGAHRFHDRIPGSTRVVQDLLGPDLVRIDVPSRISYRGRLVRFPLTPIDLCLKLGPLAVLRAATDLARARRAGPPSSGDFESHAVHRYGRTIAETFLLGYSEKLWGVPCRRLGREVGGQRTRGLDLRTLLKEWMGSRSSHTHLDGAFFYPRGGIGTIANALADSCGAERVRTDARVTRVFHDGRVIRSVEINGTDSVDVEQVVSTLPLTRLVQALDPPAPAEILESARSLRFRNLLLVMFAIGKERMTPYGSIYFADSRVPFTRMYEPKNRSLEMAPPGCTSLVVEIPCSADDATWRSDDDAILTRTRKQLVSMGWLREPEILGSCVQRIGHAYPVLELDSDVALRILWEYLERFENLVMAGRNGRFAYTHIHDMIEAGHDTIRVLEERRARFQGGRAGLAPPVVTDRS
ncbi:MAG: FAD-dependent oxidoreductase [Candidatus Eisenbacteria bacterium]